MEDRRYAFVFAEVFHHFSHPNSYFSNNVVRQIPHLFTANYTSIATQLYKMQLQADMPTQARLP